jgi:hypothetical protein
VAGEEGRRFKDRTNKKRPLLSSTAKPESVLGILTIVPLFGYSGSFGGHYTSVMATTTRIGPSSLPTSFQRLA